MRSTPVDDRRMRLSLAVPGVTGPKNGVVAGQRPELPKRGAVAKSEAARDLLHAVKAVLEGGTFFPGKPPSHSASV